MLGSANNDKSLGGKIFTGYLFSLGLKFFNRLVGLVSIFVLARLLAPENYGVAATVSIVIAFFDVLTTSGPGMYLIQKIKVTDEDIDSCWSLNLCLKTIAAVALFASSDYAAVYFDSPELSLALKIVALKPIIGGLRNTGFILYSKNLHFKPAFQIGAVAKLLSFTAAISIALYSRSYWALIIADMVSVLVASIGSYVLHPYRPKFSTKNWLVQWKFSRWLLLSSIFGFAGSKIDALFAIKLIGESAIGIFTVAQNIAFMPVTQLISPLSQPIFAGFSTIKSNQLDLVDKFYKASLLVLLIIFPLSCCVFILAEPIVTILLGDKWSAAIPVFSFMGILLINQAFGIISESVLKALGRVDLSFSMGVFSFAIVFGVLYFNPISNISDLTFLRAISSPFLLVFSILVLRSVLSFNVAYYFAMLSLPLTCCIAAGLLANFFTMHTELGQIPTLILGATILGGSYLSLLVLVLAIFQNYFSEYNYALKNAGLFLGKVKAICSGFRKP